MAAVVPIQPGSAGHEGWGRALFDAMDDAVFVHDFAGNIIEANTSACQRLGYSREELLRLHTDDIDDPTFASGFVDRLDHQKGAGQLRCEGRHRTKDGRTIEVDINTSVVEFHGKPAVMAIMRDITLRKAMEDALRESERRYRRLTEATQDGIIVADQDGLITLFNPAAERLFGYQSDEIVGQPLDTLMPEEFRAQHHVGFRRYLETRQSKLVGKPVELSGRRKDGTIFPVELALSVLDLGGGLVQFLGSIRDLTERNRMRAVLVQNEKLASIGLLSAGVAHEINNPLAFVANNLAVLERDTVGLIKMLDLCNTLVPRLAATAPDEVARLSHLAEEVDFSYVRENVGRLLTRTREGVDRVTRIVRSLRGLARTDTPKRQEISLPLLVDATLEIIRGRLKRHNVALVTHYDAHSTIDCVQTQVGQVLLNLLVNAQQAIEATGRTEGGEISVRTKRFSDEMLIEIADNGSGIDPDILPKLFDPFFTTKDVGEGTGLGLSIAHNIVRAHGGRIDVESQLGVGTQFRVYLPLQSSRVVP